MDLVDYREEVYEGIVEDFKEFASRLDIADMSFIPVSALRGDNVVDKSAAMPWYHGPTLLYHLENVYVGPDANHVDARLPVQWVIRPHSEEHHDFRGYAGRVAGGVFKPGDEVVVLPSGFTSAVRKVHTMDGELPEAFYPMSVSLTLEDEIDISRGDMIAKPHNLPHIGQDIDLMLCWFSEKQTLRKKGKYILRHTTREMKCLVQEVFYKIDVNTLHKIEEGEVEIGLNDIGRVQVRTSRPLFYDTYRRNRITGSVVLIDEFTNETVAAGMIR
jgi:sulfate adenylyltransferase subunit 1